jgi:hypothetical protein
MRFYAMLGPVFFFKCYNLLEETEYILSHGKRKPPMSEPDMAKLKEILRGVVEPSQGQLKEKKNVPQVSVFAFSDHPPVWLRGAIIGRALSELVYEKPEYEIEADMREVGLALIANVDILWEESIPDLLAVYHRSQSTASGEKN